MKRLLLIAMSFCLIFPVPLRADETTPPKIQPAWHGSFGGAGGGAGGAGAAKLTIIATCLFVAPVFITLGAPFEWVFEGGDYPGIGARLESLRNGCRSILDDANGARLSEPYRIEISWKCPEALELMTQPPPQKPSPAEPIWSKDCASGSETK